MESYITNKLLKLYPTRVVKKLSSKHASLYRLIGVTAQEKNKNIKEFLEELGFTYVTGHRGISSTFDAITARLLIDEYGISQSNLAQWQGISRQAISSKLSKNTVGTEWITNNLTLEEQVVVKDMIENKLFTIHNENLTIAIRTNYKRAAIIVVNENVTKVVFNFSEEINWLIKAQRLDVFSEIDFEVREGMKPVTIMGNSFVYVDTIIRNKIRQQCRKHGVSEEEYCKLHGYAGVTDGRTFSDKEIEDIIKLYVIKENYVYLPHNAEHYYRFTNRAHRANMSLDEFFEFFGYIKVDSRLNSSYDSKMEGYKLEIRRYLIEGSDQKVLLKSDSNLYRKLYSFAKRRGITLEELLQDLGFERVFGVENNVTFSNSYETNLTNFKDIILKELENIQGNMERESSLLEKTKRNKQLVRKLKELYGYRCQLCGKENLIPLIRKEDGTYYVEVHHIKALSTKYLVENDEHAFDDMLDHYLNAIVVCPFHHKVLHYHDGGFERIVKQDNDLFFISKKETLLKIEINFHISEKDSLTN
ncbi:hypothetical protein [Bacillus albus]|uniref:hypothetical protein n=1 Tax=Bacillus albus TaxID=2026189 RepID=UPI00141998D2|nr:hypothetical protein [Bacillus albus]